MSSELGKKLKITLFGESHGPAVGFTAEGFPAGEAIDMARLRAFMARRAPGANALSTPRREPDEPEFISGVTEGTTNGFPICCVIRNLDRRSGDYEALRDTPRPSHADLTAFLKWGGAADMRGGGHFSGRLTAPLCAAGGIAKEILARRGIFVGGHLAAAAGISDDAFPLYPDAALFDMIAQKRLPVINDRAGEAMEAAILLAATQGDSVGGVVECAVTGLPGGLGGPLFGGLESRLAQALFGIPAVKGLEFGSGFGGSGLWGSENNDPFIIKDGAVATRTNNAGGINGGITNGMPVVFRLAVKPTPSISAEQKTVSLSRMEAASISIAGRHDPCVAHRAVPAAEAAAALVILDILLEEGKF